MTFVTTLIYGTTQLLIYENTKIIYNGFAGAIHNIL